jgi:hypothetical protein
MLIKIAALLLFFSLLQSASGQAGSSVITNSDIISMAKAGIGEKTIILTIQRGPTKFDTSPQALILLKKAGLSDRVLDAVLATNQSLPVEPNTRPEVQSPAPAPAPMPKRDKPQDADALFQRALDAIGPKDQVLSVQSTRSKADVVQTSSGNTLSFERETSRVYPDSAAIVFTAAGTTQTEVITHEFGYKARGDRKTQMSWADVVTTLQLMKLSPIYISQHSDDFKVEFACQEVSNCYRLKISALVAGTSVFWTIDPQSGQIRSAQTEKPLPEQQTEFSDYRLVSGVSIPFHSVETSNGKRTEASVQRYQINPSIDAALFEKPVFPTFTPNPTPTVATVASGPTGLTLRVLQSESVPYTQESRGGISTTCNIVGDANTSAYAHSTGNSAYGTATTNWNQQMKCNSYDTTIRWPHVLNAMFVQASNGNSYIIACDRAWRWSKCVPLRVGDTFSARFSDKGIEVEAVSSKGKEERPTYSILRSAVSR